MSAAGGGHHATDRGTSAPFQVVGDADHFVVRLHPPSRFRRGDSVELSIIARDALNSTVHEYSGAVSIADLSGTISVDSAVGWSNGVGTATVSFRAAFRNDTVTVTAGTVTGTSGRFTVLPAVPV